MKRTVKACFKPGAVNATARNTAPPSETLPWVWTQWASFHESALWKLILIPLHSYKFLFHKGSVLTASLVLHHRETVCRQGKLNDLILPRGVRNTVTIKKCWHFNEPQTKAFIECVIITANPKKKHDESFAKPIKYTFKFSFNSRTY